eukprot:c21223_g1_i4.p1 GENE.c21223_g1_i4~~c21223_g1_i4.p1  ORF type:complete len:284 (+),score=116.60 c21223_g1_i4:646-1497(+)
MLQLQEKGVLKRSWKPLYFLLTGNDIVYGEPENPSLVAVLNILAETDLIEPAKISFGSDWSVFEKEGVDGFAFEIHNPKGTSLLVRSDTADLRTEWITILRERLRLLQQNTPTAPVVSVPTPAQEPKHHVLTSQSTQEIVKSLISLGFSSKLAEQAAGGSKDVNEAIEKAMTIQALEGETGSSGSSNRSNSNTNINSSNNNTTPPQTGGTAKCGNCGSRFSYPGGVSTIQCQVCHVHNSIPANFPTRETIALQCGLCHTRADVPSGQSTFSCKKCGATNRVES